MASGRFGVLFSQAAGKRHCSHPLGGIRRESWCRSSKCIPGVFGQGDPHCHRERILSVPELRPISAMNMAVQPTMLLICYMILISLLDLRLCSYTYASTPTYVWVTMGL